MSVRHRPARGIGMLAAGRAAAVAINANGWIVVQGHDGAGAGNFVLELDAR